MLQPIKQKSLTDLVEEQIYSYVKEKKIVPGDSFPGEKNLAELLQVSRPIIREALSRFRMLGFVKSKKRRGMIVSKPCLFQTIEKVLNLAFLDKKEKEDFFNLRITIELGLADLLVKNISPKDINKLEDIVREEERNPEDFELYLESDFIFHLSLYKATGCKSLASFQNILYSFFGDKELRYDKSSPNFAKRFSEPERCNHRDILEAIKKSNPEKIQAAMRSHLNIHLNP